jgi:hypothetical protein
MVVKSKQKSAVEELIAANIATNASGLSPAEINKLLVPTLPQGVDPTKMNLAYGRRAIPKLVRIISFLSLFL